MQYNSTMETWDSWRLHAPLLLQSNPKKGWSGKQGNQIIYNVFGRLFLPKNEKLDKNMAVPNTDNLSARD